MTGFSVKCQSKRDFLSQIDQNWLVFSHFSVKCQSKVTFFNQNNEEPTNCQRKRLVYQSNMWNSYIFLWNPSQNDFIGLIERIYIENKEKLDNLLLMVIIEDFFFYRVFFNPRLEYLGYPRWSFCFYLI